jgi:hypothetical protein
MGSRRGQFRSQHPRTKQLWPLHSTRLARLEPWIFDSGLDERVLCLSRVAKPLSFFPHSGYKYFRLDLSPDMVATALTQPPREPYRLDKTARLALRRVIP